MLFFGTFQNSSESGWCVLTAAFLPQAAPSSAHQPGHWAERAVPWTLRFFSSWLESMANLAYALTFNPKTG